MRKAGIHYVSFVVGGDVSLHWRIRLEILRSQKLSRESGSMLVGLEVYSLVLLSSLSAS